MSWIRFLLLSLLIVHQPALQADAEQGRRISVNGLPSPAVLACVNCHRESGLGTSESGTTVPPVAWKLLQQGGLLSRHHAFRSSTFRDHATLCIDPQPER